MVAEEFLMRYRGPIEYYYENVLKKSRKANKNQDWLVGAPDEVQFVREILDSKSSVFVYSNLLFYEAVYFGRKLSASRKRLLNRSSG
jgi:hypothetical protein